MSHFCKVGYESFLELEFAHQQRVPIIPLRLHQVYPPQPADEIGRFQNRFVLKPSLVYIGDEQMQKPREVADKIAEALAARGLFPPAPATAAASLTPAAVAPAPAVRRVWKEGQRPRRVWLGSGSGSDAGVEPS